MPVTLLCVHHNAQLIGLALRILQNKGYEVITVATAQKALDVLATTRCNCLITDYCTPELRGGLLLVQIARTYPDLPIVLLCSSTEVVPLELQTFVSTCIETKEGTAVLLEAVEEAVCHTPVPTSTLKRVV